MPYYAAIFNSRLSSDREGYEDAAQAMLQWASRSPGFLGVDSVRGADGQGITISYWESLDAIDQWRHNPKHEVTKAQGKRRWYDTYRLRIARVEEEWTP